MKWQGALACGCAAFALSVWSCSGSGSSSDGGTNDSGNNNGNDSGTGGTQGAQHVANAICQQLGACAPFPLEAAYGDVSGCASRLVLSISDELGINGVSVSQSQLEACATAYSNLTCADFANGVVPSACSVTGSLANGTACGTGLQCQSGYCKTVGGANCGVCATKVSGGGACTSSADCVAGDYCNSSSICAALAGAGADCDGGIQCLGAYYCDSSSLRCQLPATTVGASCGSSGSCSGELGLFCSPFTQLCAQAILSGAGQACGLVGASLVGCVDGGSCALTTATAGTCVAPAGDGTACAIDGGAPQCLQPATCQQGLCTLPNPGGCH